MTYQVMKTYLGLEVSPEADAACRFLESRGQRFCIDFGTKNAFDAAVGLMEKELQAEMVGMCIYCGQVNDYCLAECEDRIEWDAFMTECRSTQFQTPGATK